MISVRKAKVTDALPLAVLHVDSSRSAYEGLYPSSHWQSFTYDSREEHFREALSAETEETYVAERDGAIVGFVILGPSRNQDLESDSTGEIWGIYVAPPHWRRGVGTSLFEYAKEVLKARKFTKAVLWVLADNANARCFYEGFGFQLDGATKELFRDDVRLQVVRYAMQL